MIPNVTGANNNATKLRKMPAMTAAIRQIKVVRQFRRRCRACAAWKVTGMIRRSSDAAIGKVISDVIASRSRNGGDTRRHPNEGCEVLRLALGRGNILIGTQPCRSFALSSSSPA
ncbi:hypothetical protein G4G27_06550 [Sphingomonas sp. So64.6b]|uniref:hypothetical protein n=1 Tax=Sphingomonas sp. So64.6b TaxID=2997354 RepID=UPI001600A20C|nr:hypothetical protein [Sphingomonas sp. So64.6b]QNA83691.1 hypothetical protein G4G27_06550 [Sphingomonas sp. So64.6b]